MNNIPRTSATTSALSSLPPTDDEEVVRAFDDNKEVKPSDIGNELSQRWPENAGCLLQERSVALFCGDRVKQMRREIEAFLRSLDSNHHGYFTTKFHDLLKVVDETLSHPLNQDWSKIDADMMRGLAHMIIGHLIHYGNELPSERVIIEHKIEELRQYIDTIKRNTVETSV
ncbi:hypothetical protein [Endozoicomonas sp. 2B-B]